METVDIIDPQNNVIGRETRENAHKKGYLHRCIIAELRDKKRNWIFVKQSSQMQDSGQLASAAGGHIRSGEKELSALKREVAEELGIKKFAYKHKGNIIYKRNILDRVENHFFIVYEIEADGIITLNEESEGFYKFTTKKLKEKLKNEPEQFGDALAYIIRNLYPALLE